MEELDTHVVKVKQPEPKQNKKATRIFKSYTLKRNLFSQPKINTNDIRVDELEIQRSKLRVYKRRRTEELATDCGKLTQKCNVWNHPYESEQSLESDEQMHEIRHCNCGPQKLSR